MKNPFNKNESAEAKKERQSRSAATRKQLEEALALQRRHPFLDRFLMLAGIAGIIIMAIPFIYIAYKLSIFNMIGGGFQNIMNGTTATGSVGLLNIFDTFGMVPVFYMPWSQAGWLFATIGTVLLIAIIIGIVFLAIIYIRDFITIIKGIGYMLRQSTEDTGKVIKEQATDVKRVFGGAPIASEEVEGKKKKSSKKKKEEEDDEAEDLEKHIEEIKKDISSEEPVAKEVKAEESVKVEEAVEPKKTTKEYLESLDSKDLDNLLK